MEGQFDALRRLACEVSSHGRVPGAATPISKEVDDLERKWHPMKDTIKRRLEGMRRALEVWVMGKRDAMKEVIGEEDGMLSRTSAFIMGFPFDELLEVDLGDLLCEVEELVMNEVS